MRVDSATFDIALTKDDLSAYRQTGQDPVQIAEDLTAFLTEQYRAEGLMREPVQVVSANWQPVTWDDQLDDTAAFLRLTVHQHDPGYAPSVNLDTRLPPIGETDPVPDGGDTPIEGDATLAAPAEGVRGRDLPPETVAELWRRHQQAVAEGKPGVVYDTHPGPPHVFTPGRAVALDSEGMPVGTVHVEHVETDDEGVHVTGTVRPPMVHLDRYGQERTS